MLGDMFELCDWRIVALTLFVGYIVYWILQVRGRGLPPGPFPLPVLGNMLGMGGGPQDQLMMSWNKKYGDVFMFYIGSQRMVHVCGLENIKDFFLHSGDSFIDRPPLLLFKKTSKGFKGISFSSGAMWKENRKCGIKALRDMMGAERQSLQEKIVEEGLALQELFAEMEGQTVDLRPIITNSVHNIICSLVFGRRFERGDPELGVVVDAVRELLSSAMKAFIVNFMPWLQYVPFVPKPEDCTDKVDEFVLRKIKEHQATFDPTKPPRDVIDIFLQMQHAHGDETPIDEDNLQVIVTEFFIAGGDTIVFTMMWLILFLAVHEDIQKECREKIRDVLGKDGNPNMDLREKLPFVEALVQETLRCGDIAALGDLRHTAKDIEFKGFRIPKGTVVMPLLCSVHKDPTIWSDPDKFQPERWLDKDGKLVRHEGLMPFSLGRRNCLGENMARTELFILTIMLFQQFSFSIPEGETASTEGVIGVMRVPLDYKVVIHKVE